MCLRLYRSRILSQVSHFHWKLSHIIHLSKIVLWLSSMHNFIGYLILFTIIYTHYYLSLDLINALINKSSCTHALYIYTHTKYFSCSRWNICKTCISILSFKAVFGVCFVVTAYVKHDTRHWFPDFDLDKTMARARAHAHTGGFLYVEWATREANVFVDSFPSIDAAVSRAEKWRKCLNFVRRFGAKRWKRGLSESKRESWNLFSL